MSTELTYLVATAALTSVLWMPYILNRLVSGKGLLHEVGYPDEPTVLSPWADRLKRAHANAVEHLVVFAPLVLTAHVAQISTEATSMAAIIYFWARVVHAAAFTFAIPWIRTLSFCVGWAAMVTFAFVLLTA